MGQLKDEVESQHEAIGELRKDVAACREEGAALRECLVLSGVLRSVGFQVQLHRHRFASARALHGFVSEARLEDIFCSHDVAVTISLCAGSNALRAVCAASRMLSAAGGQVARRVTEAPPGDVYVCGGQDGASELPSVERFCLARGCWEQLPPMSERRRGASACILGGRLYVCGGHNGEQELDSVEVFGFDDGAWQTLAPMLSARWGAACGILDRRLYICGGIGLHGQRLRLPRPWNSAEGSLQLHRLGAGFMCVVDTTARDPSTMSSASTPGQQLGRRRHRWWIGAEGRWPRLWGVASTSVAAEPQACSASGPSSDSVPRLAFGRPRRPCWMGVLTLLQLHLVVRSTSSEVGTALRG
mmetsp:Transcript_81803/g.264072  ORF Transcript_81803/g.264072 Transcript_81803/m.264072 type:complete len:358 (+) Transcript_81803:56-1129(+)